MAATDSPPIGLSHPTVNPNPSEAGQRGAERCRCTDCGYTVETGEDLPPTCPECGGALTLVTA